MESQSNDISINDTAIQNITSISEQTPAILKSLKRGREQGPTQKRSRLENQEIHNSVSEVQEQNLLLQGNEVDIVSVSEPVEHAQPLDIISRQQVLSGEEKLDMLKRKELFRVEVVIEKIQMPNENVNRPKVEGTLNSLTVDDDLMDLIEGEISDLDSDLLLSSEDESAQSKNITSNEIAYKKVEQKNSLDKNAQMTYSASARGKKVVSKETSDEDIFDDSSDLDFFTEENSDTDYEDEDDEYKGPSVRDLNAFSPRRSERQRRPPEILAFSQSPTRQKVRPRRISQKLNNILEDESVQPTGTSKDHYQLQSNGSSVKKENHWDINDSNDNLSSENSDNSQSDYSSEVEKKENIRDTKLTLINNSTARTVICPSLPIPKSECKICGGLRPMSRLLSCHDCNLCVHSDCYGQVGYKDTPSIWRCDPCLNKKNPKVAKICKCVLCALPEGENNAMKRTAGYNWCHVICAAFFPQVSFRDAESVSMIEDVMNVDEISWKTVCFICKKIGGATLNCAHSDCQIAFHVTCAQKKSTCQICFEIIPNNELESDIDSIDFGNGIDGDLSPKIFCQNHRTSLATFVKLSDRGINDNFSAIYTFIRIHKQFQFQGAEERRRYRFRDLIFTNDRPPSIQDTTHSPSLSSFATLSLSLSSPPKECLSPTLHPNLASTGFSRPPPTVCAKCGTSASPMWWPRDKEQQENFLNCRDLGVKKIHGTKFPQLFSPLTFGRILGESICHKCYWKEKKNQ
ncbi:11118_t:CDS:2 [Ambispora leptoticha]|uniref:11118_t:CDS:1 n=1 Tax=Ambispora leptoticha TaxID=144679 RepID=A0A9N9GE17_9GLOM|nr:11118_t:CDS:2 [Ambispora leptoticha]